MFGIASCELPEDALLATYRDSGAYADCYAVDIPRRLTQASYVQAFYSTPVFRIERLILKWAVSRPSTDREAQQLALGSLDQFAAWTVEARADNQLLLCDFMGRTRSWLMAAPLPDGRGTRLYFGSAVVPVHDPKSGQSVMGRGFRLMLGFHKLYSQILLHAARRRLAAG